MQERVSYLNTALVEGYFDRGLKRDYAACVALGAGKTRDLDVKGRGARAFTAEELLKYSKKRN